MSLAPGARLGSYEILSAIGAGGMGEVWKARDPQLDREVALKILPAWAAADPLARERFIREAKSASALNHPNIVTIYEINSDGDTLFIAMELVRGTSLAAMLRDRQPLRPDVVLKYARQLAAGLARAHRAGIVHRDIKPSNIMVTDDGLVKVLDFGLAKLATPGLVPGISGSDDETTIAKMELTRAGTVVGTVPYMSPEQVAGDAADPRSDVFSMGVVLYEMLGGHRPFGGATNAEILRSVLLADPPSLETRVPDVPLALVRIVNRSLQKKPEDRYQNADELSGALGNLDRAETELPVTVRPVPAGGRRVRWVGALVLVVGGGLGAYAVWSWRAPDPRGASIAAEDVTPVEALDRAHAFLLRYDRKGNVDRAMATLTPVLERHPENAALRAALSEAYFRQYGLTADKSWLPKALTTAQEAVKANDDLGAAHVALAVALAASGKGDDARREFERARDLDPLSGDALLGLAKLRAASPDGEAEAQALFDKAAQLSTGDWRPLAEQAIFHYRKARYEQAIDLWKRALQLAPDNARHLVNVSAAYQMTNRYDEAADVLQRALAIDPIAGTWTNLGTARFFQGRYGDAVKAMEKATELTPSYYLYWGNLGDVYRWAPGFTEKAGPAYTKAIQLVRERIASNPQDAAAKGSLAVYLAKNGDTASALKALTVLGPAVQKDPGLAFKAALVFELSHQRKQALDAVANAARAGYSPHEIATDPDLAALRQDAAYTRIVPSAPGKH